MSGYMLPTMEERLLPRILLRAEDADPDAPALLFPRYDREWTYGALVADARLAAGGLRRLGLEPGDRLGIMLPNRPEYAVAWFGAQLGGLVDVAINHELVGAMLEHAVNVAEVKAVVCDPSSCEALQAAAAGAPGLERLIVVAEERASGGPVPTVAFGELLAGDAGERPAADATAIASIRYTSGTTGAAKAIGMTHSQMAVFAGHANWMMEAGHRERLYTCFPLHHTFASMLGVIVSFQVGGCCIVDERFSASRYWETIRAVEATRAHIIPPLVPILMTQPRSANDVRHRCQWSWTGFHNPEYEKRFNTRLVPFYGMSEGSVMAFVPPGEKNRPGAAGKVNPLFELRIADEDDEPVAPGVEGEILWRPRRPHLMMDRYVGAADVTVESWRGLWFHSGDRGVLDEDGYLFFLGRNADQIRRKGVNVSAQAIETAARGFPGVLDAVAIAVPSELGDSEAKLCLVMENGPAAPDELAEYLREHLPRDYVPRYVEFRDDLPRTSTFKVLRRQLQAEGDRGLTDATLDLEAARRG